MPKKKASAQSATAEQSSSTASSSSLVICRNKHWRYISSFHGPWLHLPIEILESLAHQNWTMPSPRLIDPAVFFDVLKIRKYVDEAAHDSVRASAGISNNAMTGRMDYFGAGGGPGSQLSKERIFKIRQKAVGLLEKAFTLDEVAASVATMQATSTIEDVAQHVLKREQNNISASYVHFFQEKVPSRAMEQHTSLQPLTDIISTLPWEHQAAPLRTRGLTCGFKQQYEQAAMDFTLALRVIEELKRVHKPNQQQLELASKMRAQQEAWQKGFKDWRSIPHLKDEDQPKSLEMQLHFYRANVYLTIAVGNIHAALDGLKEHQAAEAKGELNDTDTTAHAARLEARKRVKTNAKRALKDYMAFLSNLEYTPGLPYEITNEIMRRIHDLARGRKPPPASPTDLDASDTEGSPERKNALVKADKHKRESYEKDGWPDVPLPKVYPASTLFAERPPQDLPPFPGNEFERDTDTGLLKEALSSREMVTYHPLLTEALHSLLLAHALLQTSVTELQRHAYNVARLARITDGYPIFQTSRSPARSDWQEVLTESKGWLNLASSWPKLCALVPLPEAAGGLAVSTSSKGRELQRHKPTGDSAEQRIKHESIIEALSDERVVDEVTFRKAVRAREERAVQQDGSTSAKLLENGSALADAEESTTKEDSQPAPKNKPENGNGAAMYPISSERAQAIARWVLEAPLSMGGKKKRPSRKKKPADHTNALAESVSTLSIDIDDDVD